MRVLLVVAALIAAVVATRPGATNPNQITSLPGLTFPINFTMSALSAFSIPLTPVRYSGYITVNPAEGPQPLLLVRYLTQNAPATDPVIAWFQVRPRTQMHITIHIIVSVSLRHDDSPHEDLALSFPSSMMQPNRFVSLNTSLTCTTFDASRLHPRTHTC